MPAFLIQGLMMPIPLSPIIPISSSSHAGEKEEDLNRLEQWARQGATLISYGGLNRMAGRLGCTRFAIRDAVYGNLSGLKYAQGIPVLRAVISDPWMVSQTSVMPVEADGVLRRLQKMVPRRPRPSSSSRSAADG